MKKFIVSLLSTFFRTGYFFFAPATFASFVWLLVYLFVPGGAWLVHPVVVACVLPVAVYVSHEAEKHFGHDSPRIVIDEVVGMQVTLLAVEPTILSGVIGFVVFRLLDILKPFPARRAERLPGGFGIVADDVVAGAYGRLLIAALAPLLNR